MRRFSGLLIGLAFCAGLVWWIDRHVGFDRLMTPWLAVSPWLAAAVLLTQLSSYAARAARLAQLEAEIGWNRCGAALRLVLLHNALNLLLPMRSGEASFPLLMQRSFGSDPLRAGGLLLWLRICDLHVLAIAALLAALQLGAPAGIVSTILLLAAIAPLLLYRLRPALMRCCDGDHGRAARWARKIIDGLPQDRRAFSLSLLWTWAAWTIKLLGLGSLLAALLSSGTALGLLGAIGGDLSTVLPIHAPGGFGTYEAGVAAMVLPWFQGAAPALLAAAVNLHLFVLSVALGFAAVAGLLTAPRRAVTAG